MAHGDPIAFIHDCRWEAVPQDVLHHARRNLLDTLAVAGAGAQTDMGRLLRDHAATCHGPASAGGARLIFDGRRVGIPAAVMAGAGLIDSFDAHDGHRLTKGHAGVAVVPAALAVGDELAPSSLDEFLLRLVVGYEIGTRAGIALHRVAPDYHTSGAWNALGVAALCVRALGLDGARTAAALGAAEFHAPRGLMMRVIDRPSMLKDGSQMGAFAGVNAALLARDGFSAGPAELLEAEDAADLWRDLGTRWYTAEQYLKPFPVCRWAQPALEAAARLRESVSPERIARVRIATFEEAVRLAGAAPESTDAAQYAIAFPVAAYLRHGRLGATEISGPALRDPATLDLAARIELVSEPRFDARFPAERWCEMTIETTDGDVVTSGEVTTRGDAESPLTDAEVVDKARALLHPLLGEGDTERLIRIVFREFAEAPARLLLDAVLGGGDAAMRF